MARPLLCKAAGQSIMMIPLTNQADSLYDQEIKRVLLVEVNCQFAVRFETVLTEGRFEVLTATSAAQAEGRLTENRFDLVLLDLGLPADDLASLSEEISASNPFVAVIGTAAQPTLTPSAREFGVDLVVEKTVEPEGFLFSARRLCQESEAAQLNRIISNLRAVRAGVEEGGVVYR